MGIGPPILGLYRQLKAMGVLEGVTEVVELGAQHVWCPRAQLVKDLFQTFGKPEPPADMLDRFANWKGSGLELYQALGFNYRCIDVDPNFNSILMDLNFDECAPDQKGKYEFVTNHGTSEHLINQYNFFKVTHDLTKVNGLMLHAVPFTAHIEHGFFNYQPNFFDALARYNSYKMYGVWVGPDWQIGSLIPWDPNLLDFLVINSKTTHLLVVLMQKMYDKDFCVPFQGVYEQLAPDNVMARYNVIVDGDLYDGKRLKHIEKDKVIADRVAHETLVIRNEFDSLNGKYWDMASRIAAAEAEIGPLKQELVASQLRNAALQAAVVEKGADQLAQVAERGYLANISGREILNELGRRVRRKIAG